MLWDQLRDELDHFDDLQPVLKVVLSGVLTALAAIVIVALAYNRDRRVFAGRLHQLVWADRNRAAFAITAAVIVGAGLVVKKAVDRAPGFDRASELRRQFEVRRPLSWTGPCSGRSVSRHGTLSWWDRCGSWSSAHWRWS